MTTLGLVINVGFPETTPSAAEIDALGLRRGGWLRSICYRPADFERALTQIGDGPRWCVLLNPGELEGIAPDWSNYRDLVGDFCQRFRGRVHAIELGNEFDLWYDPSDAEHYNQARFHVPAARTAELANAVGPLVRSHGLRAILASVAGRFWQEYLADVAARLQPGAVDWCAWHGYGQRMDGFPGGGWGFGEYGPNAVHAANLGGLPVALTEYGVKIGDAGGEAGQAEYVRRSAAVLERLAAAAPMSAYFAWHDGVGAPTEQRQQAFGLRALDGHPRRAWFAAQKVFGGSGAPPVLGEEPTAPPPPSPEPARFVEGFARWAAAEPTLIGQPLENECGFARGVSWQRTSGGDLLWVAPRINPDRTTEPESFGFVRRSDGARFRWVDGAPRSERVA